MINITLYCKNKNIDLQKIKNFKKMQRIKPFLTSEHFVSKSGAFGFTMMSDYLFSLFCAWVRREPLPLLNRQEYDVLTLLKAVYPKIIHQYKISCYVYDFYIPNFNLLIEYDECHHSHSKNGILKSEEKSNFAINNYNFFKIYEKTAIIDMANLINKFRINAR